MAAKVTATYFEVQYIGGEVLRVKVREAGTNNIKRELMRAKERDATKQPSSFNT